MFQGSNPVSPSASIAVNLVGGPPNVHSLIPDESPQSASGCRLHRCRGRPDQVRRRLGHRGAVELGRFHEPAVAACRPGMTATTRTAAYARTCTAPTAPSGSSLTQWQCKNAPGTNQDFTP